MRGTMLWVLLACGLFAAPLGGDPLPAGTYTPVDGGGGFTVDASGVVDNGDALNCRTGLTGDVLTLDCHGHRLSDVVWRQGQDGRVHTDLYDRVYGEGDPATAAFHFVPAE